MNVKVSLELNTVKIVEGLGKRTGLKVGKRQLLNTFGLKRTTCVNCK